MRFLLSKATLRTEPHNFPDHRNNYFWSKLSQYFALVKDFRKKCILRRLRVRIPKKLSPFQSKCPLTKKRSFFVAYRLGIRMILSVRELMKNQGHIFVSMRTHRLRGSARRVQLECALQSPTNHGYANMKIERIIF